MDSNILKKKVMSLCYHEKLEIHYIMKIIYMSELSNVQKWLVQSNYLKNIAKNDSKLDFEYKSVPQIQSNAKVTQKPSEITTAPL